MNAPIPRSDRFRRRSRREKVLINFSGMPIDFFDNKSQDDRVSLEDLNTASIDLDRKSNNSLEKHSNAESSS